MVCSMGMKSSLDWYMCKTQPRSECFYDGSVGSELFFKARTKSLEVYSRVYRWSNEGSKICRMCERGVDETIEHLLLQCEGYDREREMMLYVVKREMGEGKWEEICEMQEWELVRPVLCLLGLSRMDKWNRETVESVKDFLERVWMKRSLANEDRERGRRDEGDV